LRNALIIVAVILDHACQILASNCIAASILSCRPRKRFPNGKTKSPHHDIQTYFQIRRTNKIIFLS
jgi:hypothetical protein